MQLKRRLVALLLVLSISLSLFSCGKNSDNANNSTFEIQTQGPSSDSELTAFNDYTDELFKHLVSVNTITLHSFVKDPANFGITDYDVTLGDLDLDELDDTSDVVEELTKLKSFDRNTLTSKQQLTYDILLNYFNTCLEYSDLYLFNTALTPTIGMQVELPIVYAEYAFESETDVTEYITLLKETDSYYQSMLDFEKLRADNGLFMSDDIADKVIDQCNIFIEKLAEDNYLISTFNERLSNVTSISEAKREEYKAANEAAINEHIIPAYKLLISGLTALKGSNKTGGGLCNYANGKKYFEYLLESELGWGKSVDEYNSLLDKHLKAAMVDMSIVISADSSVINDVDTFSFSLTDPQQILSDLKEKIKADFPAIPDVNYTIKYVDKSLEEYASPAMFFLPQLDDYKNNSIYINAGNPDVSQLYSTLAHEGYPGHMYQTTYFNNANNAPIRTLIRSGGFLEGWASYCEAYSYSLAELNNSNLGKVMSDNYLAILYMYSKVDLGVNYYGWNIDDVKKFLVNYGISDDEVATSFYTAMISEPGNYSKYAIGCLAIYELKAKAQDALGSKFNIKDFHQFLMDIGAAPFSIIENRLDIWISSQLAN